MLVQALELGMTPNQFYHDDPNLFFIYLEHYNEKQRNKMIEMDYQAWLNGMYIDYALAINHPLAKKKGDYLKEPVSISNQKNQPKIEMTEEQKEEFELKQAELLFNQFGRYAKAYNEQYTE